ncbi:MAG: 4-hydroxy-3-methylbut-2-enyl diphosphate reductase [Burkholderiales bacterium]|nr:4-hydroxy-3-methylbut-2-enyl diphosphate reductase [Burkholderiales bacterium]OUT77617.1 MAG: 4-hydroxy-3-methylbut-2-enyl diphosphate reductase [Betaproteobacteria bacterium TMED22]|tara:strand:+ start:34192 stop:35145 length:954 start_codon:yes stop_codon:yes gene_type:complete
MTINDSSLPELHLANPRGFCAGVDRAIEIVERAINKYGAPIYVKHEVVHNKYVVDGLKEKGAIFIEDLDEVPEGKTLIYSAHGVSLQVRMDAKRRKLKVFDATCPLVSKVHAEVIRHRKKGLEVIMIGHKGHPEVEGTMGQASSGILLVESIDDVNELVVTDPKKLAYVTQTTLSVDDAAKIVEALITKYPKIKVPAKEDICYATQNRQDAVKSLAEHCDLIIVVGSANSSNSNRLREVAETKGVRAFLIDRAVDLKADWLSGVSKVGVTAGASAPEVLVCAVVDRLQTLGVDVVKEFSGIQEKVVFHVPGSLKRKT